MDALRFEPSLRGEAAQDEEHPAAGQRAAAGVEEQFLPVAPLEKRASAGEIKAKRFRGLPSDGDDSFLAPLAEAANKPVFEIDRLAVEPDRLADAQSGSVEQLAEGAVTEGDRRRAGRRVEEALDLGGGERPRELSPSLRELDVRRGVVHARAEQYLVPEERANRGEPACDRGRCETVGAQLGDIRGEIVGARVSG